MHPFRIRPPRTPEHTPADVRSMLNSVPIAGVDLELKREDGTTVTVNLKEGPIYPTFGEFGPID